MPVKEKKDIIDPVNDYIMKKNYMQKFRKSKEEIKQERLNKLKNKKEKEQKEKNK